MNKKNIILIISWFIFSIVIFVLFNNNVKNQQLQKETKAVYKKQIVAQKDFYNNKIKKLLKEWKVKELTIQTYNTKKEDLLWKFNNNFNNKYNNNISNNKEIIKPEKINKIEFDKKYTSNDTYITKQLLKNIKLFNNDNKIVNIKYNKIKVLMNKNLISYYINKNNIHNEYYNIDKTINLINNFYNEIWKKWKLFYIEPLKKETKKEIKQENKKYIQNIEIKIDKNDTAPKKIDYDFKKNYFLRKCFETNNNMFDIDLARHDNNINDIKILKCYLYYNRYLKEGYNKYYNNFNDFYNETLKK